MKYRLIIAAFLLVSAACKDTKTDEKKLEAEVMEMHEKMMADGETAMQNKMKLDTLILKKDSVKKAFPAIDTSAENKTMRNLSSRILKTDDAMSDWMNKYNPDFTGKPHQEVMDYLAQQKKIVVQINTAYNSVIQESNQYLLKYKKK